MNVARLLLGRPWECDRKVKRDGLTNRYSFTINNKLITIVPLTPRQVYEDQLKMNRERDKKKSDMENEENMSVNDCCKLVLEKKIEYEKEVEFESIECFKKDEFEREKDVEIIESFHIQGSEKKSEEHCASLNLDSRTNPFEERGNDVIQNQEDISSNSINNSSIPSDSLLISSCPIARVGPKIIEEALIDRGANGGLGGVQQGTHVYIQCGIIHDKHILGGANKEQDDVYTQGASKKAQDPLHDITGPITGSSINGDMFERLDNIFGLSCGSLKSQYVSIYEEGSIEDIIMTIQAHMHAFRAHVSLSTWQMMKIHEIGVT